MKTVIQKRLFAIVYLLSIASAYSQDVYERNPTVDVESYVFDLTLNDDNDRIIGVTTATVNFTDQTDSLKFDLIGKSGKFGMTISEVLDGEVAADFKYEDNKIKINPKDGDTDNREFTIKYSGIPERGLVIDKTKFGQRSFFGDNWPNLARHWLACVDHLYDKASIEFRITAPDHYDVVATGSKLEESSLGNGMKVTTYYEPADVAMKVVTIGVTRFATKLLGTVQGIPITAWVYPENRLDGFSDYSVATNVMEYFIENIGPYSYAKLANMQAKTQWGGLENAGTIAYFENSVTGKNEVEGLIAHEIAHQWFGNSATENDWNHVWLSEGFATYFTILYQEAVYGNEKRKEELKKDRDQVIAFYKKNPSPIVDPSIKDPFKVLSTNTYQKGSWVLNMLRKKLGNDTFWKGIRNYYKAYRNSNALTADFQRAMERTSGQDLEAFFQQWIFMKGYPEIKWNWNYKNGKVTLTINQVQDHFTFNFPIEIGIFTKGQMTVETVLVNTKTKTFEIEAESKPNEVILDPEYWLLFEEK